MTTDMTVASSANKTGIILSGHTSLLGRMLQFDEEIPKGGDEVNTKEVLSLFGS